MSKFNEHFCESIRSVVLLQRIACVAFVNQGMYRDIAVTGTGTLGIPILHRPLRPMSHQQQLQRGSQEG